MVFGCVDDDGPTPTDMRITVQEVRNVFAGLPPTGYAETFSLNNLPGSLEIGYSNQTTGQNVNVGAAENLTGEVIVVTDAVIESSFLNPVNIESNQVNGISVYRSMEQGQYRVVIFFGQYLFNVVVLNDPNPAEAEAEATLFVNEMTSILSGL